MDFKQKAENLVSKFFDLTTEDKFGNAIECAIIVCDECINNRLRSGRASVVKSENNKNQYWQSVKSQLILMQKNRLNLPNANPHHCPECSWQCTCSNQPCSCCEN
jgi:hypothetical protein